MEVRLTQGKCRENVNMILRSSFHTPPLFVLRWSGWWSGVVGFHFLRSFVTTGSEGVEKEWCGCSVLLCEWVSEQQWAGAPVDSVELSFVVGFSDRGKVHFVKAFLWFFNQSGQRLEGGRVDCELGSRCLEKGAEEFFEV